MSRPVRRAGARWRLLVHDVVANTRPVVYGKSHHVQSDPDRNRGLKRLLGEDGMRKLEELDANWSTTTVLPDTEFDELVVGKWLHVEQMDTGYWWMNVAGVTIHVRANRDGKPTSVRVDGPGDYDDPVPGVTYECVWSGVSEWWPARADTPDPPSKTKETDR